MLRHYPADKVGAAFARALRRAEDSGDLAGMEPAHLFRLVQTARGGRDSGRGLYEVSLLLLDVLDRLPWEGEVHFERMIASGGRNLFAEAAAAARKSAERRRRLGFRDDEGRWSARRLEFRARLYEGLVDRKLEPFQKVLDEAWDDPMIVWLAGWYLATYRIDLALAQRVAERAVQLGGRLRHRDRDILAAVRVQQKRPKEALALLDMEARLPVKRPKRGRRSGRHLLLEALARLQLGDRSGAAFALETALLEDRRLIPVAKSDPALKPLQETVRQADVEFFDTIFRLN